jgi:hypothetical protein
VYFSMDTLVVLDLLREQFLEEVQGIRRLSI